MFERASRWQYYLIPMFFIWILKLFKVGEFHFIRNTRPERVRLGSGNKGTAVQHPRVLTKSIVHRICATLQMTAKPAITSTSKNMCEGIEWNVRVAAPLAL